MLALHQDSFGYIWIGTENGLNLFDENFLTFKRFNADPQNPNSLSVDFVWSFHEDRDGTLWIGTYGGGLNSWLASDRERLREKFRQHIEQFQIPSSNIYGMQTDDRGSLWISHNRGLTKAITDEIGSTQFGIPDGLQGNEFNMGASFKAANGDIYFGGAFGFNVIEETSRKTYKALPKVSIYSIKVMNERRSFDVPYHELDALPLSYQDRT